MGTITALFDTDEAGLCKRNGQRVTVLQTSSDPEIPMSFVRFSDGYETDAFNDELTEWRLEK